MKNARKTKQDLLREIESLSSRIAELEKLTGMEELVKERTAELLAANERLKAEIAGHKQAEAALKEVEVKVALMANALPALIAYVGADLRYQYVNATYEEWFGMLPSDVVGRYVWEVLDEVAYQSVRPYIDAALSGKNVTYEVTLSHRSKGKRTNQSTLVPHVGPDGAVQGFYVLSVDVTDCRHAEEALRRNEEQLRLLTDSLPALISYVDSDEYLRFNNKSYETWFGRSPSEISGKHIKEIFGSAAYDAIRMHLETALSGRQVSFGVFFLYRRGVRREVQCTCIPDVVGGNVRGFCMLIEDISERKQHERVLTKTLRSLGAAQRIAHLGNWDWDIENNELSWSDEIYRIFGLTPQKFGATYEAFLASVHPDDRESVNRGVDDALHSRKPYSIYHRIIRPDGIERIVHEQAEATFNERGKAIRMIGTVQDVTEAKRAEEAVQEQLRFEQFLSALSAGFINVPGEHVSEEIERRLRDVVELMKLDGGAVMQFDKDTKKIIVTHSWAFPAARSPERFVVSGKLPWLAHKIRQGALLAHEHLPDDLPEEAQAEKRFCEEGRFKSAILIPLTVGGSVLGAVAFGSYRKYQKWSDDLMQRLKLVGEILATALSRKEIEEHSRELRAELSHVSRVTTLGELAASLAHELNQPLTAVLANAQAAQRFLSDDTPDLQEIREILKDIIADDKRAGEIIHKLRALLKKNEPKFEAIHFATIAGEVIAILRNDAAIRGVSLDMQTDPNLPEVLGDRVQLQQVLMNLILNASDVVAGEKPEHRKVIVRTERQDESNVRITVRDYGPGIPENSEQLFKPFYSTKQNGLGMGLPISRSIIEAHGGTIWASNNPDRGASFSFTLQIAAGGAHER